MECKHEKFMTFETYKEISQMLKYDDEETIKRLRYDIEKMRSEIEYLVDTINNLNNKEKMLERVLRKIFNQRVQDKYEKIITRRSENITAFDDLIRYVRDRLKIDI